MLNKIIKNIKEKFKNEKSLFLMDTNLRDDYYKEIEAFQDAYSFYKTHFEEMKILKEEEDNFYDFFKFIFDLGDFLTPLNLKDVLFFLKNKESQIKISFILLDCSYLFEDFKVYENILSYIEKNFEFLNEKEKNNYFLNLAILNIISEEKKAAEKNLEKSLKSKEGVERKEKNKFLFQVLINSFEDYEYFEKFLKTEEKIKIFKDYDFEKIKEEYFKSLSGNDPFKERILRKSFEKYLKERNFSISQLNDLATFLSKIDNYFLNDHNKEVKDMTLKICNSGKKIWNREIDLEKIERGAYFHDLGKLNLPWALMDRKTALSEKEREKFKKHSILSYEILKNAGFEEEAIYALDHHKYLNGKGYPNDNLKPTFEGNIICLAESFIGAVNLSSKAKIREREELLIEFKQLRGIYFYSEIVDGLLL